MIERHHEKEGTHKCPQPPETGGSIGKKQSTFQESKSIAKEKKHTKKKKSPSKETI